VAQQHPGGEVTLMRDARYGAWLLALTLGLLLAILGAASGCAPEPTATPLPTETPTATATATITATPSPTPTRGLAVPAAATTLFEFEQDVNRDSIAEKVVAFRAESGDGLAIDDWQVMLPAGQRIEDVQVRPIEMSKRPKALVFAAEDDEVTKHLYIYAWNGEGYAAEGPVGGPLDGEEGFRSLYYYPVIEDGDFDGEDEIVITRQAEHPDYLEVKYYRWDGEKAYQYTTIYLAIPIHKPVETPQAGG